MDRFRSTREVGKILGIRPDAIGRAIWLGNCPSPIKGPAGNFLWTLDDVQRASWALLHRAYEPDREAADAKN